MTKDEKIKFIIDTFDSAVESNLSGGIYLPSEDEVWLNRYITSDGEFPTSLDGDQDLEGAYRAALNLSRIE